MKYLKTFENYSENETVLNINGNSYFEFPEEFLPLKNTLKNLNCFRNNLSVLPELPESLTILSCGSNNLSVLPKLPESVIEIDCYKNNLSVLPELPESLIKLNCGVNKLSFLTKLPTSLELLDCYNNKNLSILPELPESLTILSCWGCNLSVLSELPKSLTELYCYENKLSVLPELPKSLIEIYCGDNPWIEPIPLEYYNLAKDKNDIYNQKQEEKFGSYEFQKEFIEKYPFRIKDLEPIGVDPKIKKEYAYLFDFDQYLD